MPTPVQIGTVAGSYSRTVTASLSTAPSVGNMVFGIGSWGPADDPGPTAVTVSDNQGGVDADYGQESLSSLQRSGVFFVYRLITATVVGTFEMTVDAGPGSNVRLQIVEMEGEYEFARESSDASGQFDGGSETVNLTTGSANPDGELIAFAALTPRADGSITSVANNPPTGYTTLESRFFDPAPLVSAYKSISASETTTADFGAVVWNGGRLGAKVATYLKLGGGGGTDYALTCDTGAYSLTGVAATTTRGVRLVADVGSYGITGQAATTSRGYRLTADVGSYALTGQSAATTRGVRLVAATGAYTLTGQDATLVYAAGATNYTLTCDVGAYVLTGVDATLTYSAGAANYSLACDAGAYSLTGIDATLTYTPGTANYTLSCDVGSYALTGQSAVTSLGRRLIADVGSYSLTGVAATLNRGYRLSADTGAYAFTGYDATLSATVSTAYTLACETGVYSITGQDAALRYSGEVTRRRHAGTRKNYIIKGQKYALTDYELRMLIQQMLDEVKRPEIQVVTEKEVKQVSRRVWKRLKESLSSLEALTLEKVESVVESNVIEYDDEDDEEILMLL